MDRCRTHNIFMGKNGCKQCNAEIQKDSEKMRQLNDCLTHLTRHEEQIAINFIAAHSIMASVWDNYMQIPENRREKLKPIADIAYELSENIGQVDLMISQKMLKILGTKKHNDLIIEVMRIMDTASGRVKGCNTCLVALDYKKETRKKIERGEI